MATRLNHNADPMIAGVIFQLERALCHLAVAGNGETVAVEYFDDVSRHKDGDVVAQEQSKNTLRRSNALLGDRSTSLWRTLQIWVQGIRASGSPSYRYLIATNGSPHGRIVDSLRLSTSDTGRAQAIVAAFRAAGGVRAKAGTEQGKPSKIQAMIDDVLQESDEGLLDLAERIELVEHYDSLGNRANLATWFGIHPDVDCDIVLNATMSWMIGCLKSAWEVKQAGMISKEACLRYVRETEQRQQRRRWMPRPPSELTVSQDDIARARGRPFVDQIERIELEKDEIIEAIEHWAQFNTERHRLVLSGNILTQEWEDRSNRLRQRWHNINRSVSRLSKGASAVERGYEVFSRTTYDHHEPLGGQPCHELYMTSGHYHRLADDGVVYWHPDYKAG